MARTPLAAARSAAAAMARASSTVLASGFSHRTCLPASRAAIEISAWLEPGVQTSTRSTSSRSTSRFQSVSQAAQPSRSAAAATRARSRPQMAARRGVNGRSKKRPTVRQAWEWARPMNA
jgi:hypothetical protein